MDSESGAFIYIFAFASFFEILAIQVVCVLGWALNLNPPLACVQLFFEFIIEIISRCKYTFLIKNFLIHEQIQQKVTFKPKEHVKSMARIEFHQKRVCLEILQNIVAVE